MGHMVDGLKLDWEQERKAKDHTSDVPSTICPIRPFLALEVIWGYMVYGLKLDG